MSIAVAEFVRRVEEIAAEGPSYRLGGSGSDGTCDCIGLTIGGIKRAGGRWPGIHGSNYAARNELQMLLSIDSTAQLYVGMQLLKGREPGESGYALPARYKGGSDKRDYYHAGVVTSLNPLVITHSTGTGKPSSIKRDTSLGKWRFGGMLKRLNYADAPSGAAASSPISTPSADITVATVYTQNGGPLHIRAQPTKRCGTYRDAPCGAEVQVLSTNTGSAGWWKVKYKNWTGYAWSDYFAVG